MLKQVTVFIFMACMFAISFSANAQATLAAWNFTGNGGNSNVNAGTLAAGVNPATATLGSGLSSIDYLGNSIAATNQTASTLAAALSGNDYISFTVSPASGKSLTITSVSVRPVSQNRLRTFALFSSRNGFASGNQLGSFTANGNMNLALQAISVAGHQNLTTPTEFRVYIYGGTDQYESVGIGNRQSGLSENDLVVSGSVADVSFNVDATFTTNTITVDGQLNESGWTITNNVTKAIAGTPNNTVQYGVRWNATYLYVGARVTDANLYNDSQYPWQDDALEVYIDGNDNKGATYDTYDRQIVKAYNSSSIWINTGNSSGILHATAPISGGYSVELAIPWSNFNVTPASNLQIGFDVGNNDDDNGADRESQLIWSGTANNWTNTSVFGTLRLTGGATLSVSPSSLNFTSSAGSQNLAVTSDIAWTASDNQAWITLNPASGSGNGTIVVSVTSNSGSARNGTVTVTGSGIIRNITISQSAGGTYPNAGSSVGTNLSGVVSYSPESAFVNLAKRSLQWTTNGLWPEAGNTIANSSLNHNGYLKGGVTGWSAVLWDLPLAVSGDYVLRYDGTGTVALSDNGFGGVVQTGSTSGRVTATLTNARFLLIHISSNSSTSPVTNIRVTKAALENSSEVFDPEFITNWEKFNTLRFMDWMVTNASPIKFWQSSSGDFNNATAPKASDYSYAFKGVPVETMVALSNRIHANPWFCMPHEADDNFNTQFATYVRNNLTSDLKPFVEYSNETWNSGGYPFTVQYGYVNNMGLQAWPTLPSWEAGQKYHARRSGQIWTLWEQVYGGSAAIIRVMGGFVGHANQYWTDLKLLTDNVYQKTDAININFYFGHDIGSSSNPVSNVNEVFQKIPAAKSGLYFDMDNLRNLLANDTRYQHIKIVAYEGGQHLAQSQDGAPHQILIDANRDSRMGTEYTDMLNNWRQRGGTLFCNFSSTSVPSRYGSWGVLERQTGNASNQRIKYDAIMNWMVANPKWWTIKGGVSSSARENKDSLASEFLQEPEEGTQLSLRLHPNPSSSKAAITLINDYEGKVDVIIMSGGGKSMIRSEGWKNKDSAYETEIDISGLPGGIYIVKLRGGKEYVTKMMKQ
jgi:hypothetical protein